jgi:hypothetical protein
MPLRHPHAPLHILAAIVTTALLISVGFAMGQRTRPVVVAPARCTSP